MEKRSNTCMELKENHQNNSNVFFTTPPSLYALPSRQGFKSSNLHKMTLAFKQVNCDLENSTR